MARCFQGIEVINGNDEVGSGSYPAHLAKQLGLPGTGGSDAYSIAEIGACATRFQVPIQSERDLVREIRAGRIEPVRMPG